MPSTSTTQTSTSYRESPRYYLITNVHNPSQAEREIELHAESWKLPYSIDDSDLMFDGKPLNLLYEENKSMAEHHRGESQPKRRRGGDEVRNLSIYLSIYLTQTTTPPSQPQSKTAQ